MATVIRMCRLDEAADVVRVWAAADAQPTVTDDAASVAELLTHDPASLLVADEDGRIVGTLIAGWDGWRGNLYRLAVLPDCRRRGIATQLVRDGEGLLRARGAIRLSAIVTEDEAHAVAFWTAAGYDQQVQRLRFVKNIVEAEG
ncbi:MAG: family acetyltransferase [Acidimicrobiales bacterium]|nr:family acetyltransferase [Acidimicrobiales bacterium]